nr:VWA domain-containing protein [Rhodoferax sp.]
MQLGDARVGKFSDNLAAFGRTLRRAGVRIDPARIALAADAALTVGLDRREDLSAALEAVLISREQDRLVYRELFDAFFRDPNMAHKLLAQLLPSAQGKAEPSKRRPRVREALSPQHAFGKQAQPKPEDDKVDFDAAMTASDLQRLKHADFNALGASEYRLVERLARAVRLPLPTFAARRSRPGVRGRALHWSGVMQSAVRTGGEPLHLPRLQRLQQPLPLLVLVDVSGSMERYARLLLAFLHAATSRQAMGGAVRLQRHVFAFGTHLTDLGPAFAQADTDAMLAHASAAIADFAGGTQLGTSLAMLRTLHRRKLVGRRTLVLLITDGLDTGAPDALAQELDWLRRSCGRLLWLNPLLRFEGYAPLAQGAAVLHRYAHGMLAVHNLSKLEDLAASVAAVLRR